MAGNQEPFYVEDVECVDSTEKALKCVLLGVKPREDWGEEESFWVPRSLINEESEITEDGDMGMLVIPTWKAEELGLT